MSFAELPPPPEPPESDGVQPEEAAPAAAPSRGPLLVGLVVLVAIVSTVVAIIVWLNKPAACSDSNVVSSRFGYCLNEPPSWTAQTSSGSFDQLTQNDGSAVITIQAVALEGGATLTTFAASVRSAASTNGLEPGSPSSTTVDGVAATSWDSTLEPGQLSFRDLVFVKGDTGWIVEMTDSSGSFSDDEPALAQVMSSWRFR